MSIALSDAQIERYSRQIILPEVGGVGQARLAAARIVLAGTGPTAQVAGRYLAGAGIGHLTLSAGADGTAAALRAGNSEITVAVAPEPLRLRDDVAITVALAADLDPMALTALADRARRRAVPLVAAVSTAAGGGLHIDGSAGVCAACAAAAWQAAGADTAAADLLAPMSAAVLGAELALAALAIALEHPHARRGASFIFDAASAALLPGRPVARPDCAVCRPAHAS